jgi:putative membrane-bound dehydrogenase-like protein
MSNYREWPSPSPIGAQLADQPGKRQPIARPIQPSQSAAWPWGPIVMLTIAVWLDGAPVSQPGEWITSALSATETSPGPRGSTSPAPATDPPRSSTTAPTPAAADPTAAPQPPVPVPLPTSNAAPISAAANTVVEGIQALPGFEVTEFVSDAQAHDIFCLTFDPRGQLVVSGPGYIRKVIDRDGDGRGDDVIPFSNGPQTGAHGLAFHGKSLLAVGDAGLLRYRDQDQDDRADGPPTVLVKLKTGNEHDAHAIQRGPDGWWYLLAGNTAEITAAYASLPTSPVKQPRAGALLRFQPDFAAAEIVAHGLRNAYDFTFNSQGDIFTFDSDDERDISWPWYRPTRVFQLLPTSDTGWISQTWKRPDDFVDMPPVIGSFGRGSPTGLVCYQHRQFPESYHGAVFALDWTYGRVLCLPLKPVSETYTAESHVFLTGKGGHGFAPTDIEVGPDGCVYVAVGGRGTRGAVYRVRSTAPSLLPPLADDNELAGSLRAPQPLSAWSRQQWTAIARKRGRDAYWKAAEPGSKYRTAERVRAVEILTELFEGLSADELTKFPSDRDDAVRARAVWSYGRRHLANTRPSVLSLFLPQDGQAAPSVARAVLEALLPLPPTADWLSVTAGLAIQLGSPHRHNRELAAQVIRRMPSARLPELSKAATAQGVHAVVTYSRGWLLHPDTTTDRRFEVVVPLCTKVLTQPRLPVAVKQDALRLVQLLLGDLGPAEGTPPAFQAYTARISLVDYERQLDPLRIALADVFPTSDDRLDEELSRVLAMLAPTHQPLLEKVTSRLTADSPAVADLHWLLVAASIPVPRTVEQRLRIARALVGLEKKFQTQRLPQDSNWTDRMKDLYTRLVSLDEFLAPSLVDVEGFGQPGHVVFLSEMPDYRSEDAIQAFARRASLIADYPWTNETIFVLGASNEPLHRELVRKQYSNFAVRAAVLITLSEQPEAIDRSKFREGLSSSQPEVVEACLNALERLPASTDIEEQAALLKAMRRLGGQGPEAAQRARIAPLLRRNTDLTVTSPSSPSSGTESAAETAARLTAEANAWTAALLGKWPEIAQSLDGGAAADLTAALQILADVPWERGDAAKGEVLYRARACAQCHGGRSALGPSLEGVTGRFSREDLLTAIVAPSRDVSARYQTEHIETDDGRLLSGLIVYESVDGLLLRTATQQTYRIETSQIVEREKSAVSLMPIGLLKDLTATDYADLFAYLATLGTPSANRTVSDQRPATPSPTGSQ